MILMSALESSGTARAWHDCVVTQRPDGPAESVLPEGDLVGVHSRVSHGSNQPEISVVHIFRFAGDQIDELWDVGMQAPPDSPNKNGMF